MSWGTCYTGSNNIHFDKPPQMSDGRNYSSWEPDATINDGIKKNAKDIEILACLFQRFEELCSPKIL